MFEILSNLSSYTCICNFAFCSTTLLMIDVNFAKERREFGAFNTSIVYTNNVDPPPPQPNASTKTTKSVTN